MKKVNALVLGLAVLLAFGCGGDEPEPDSNQNPSEQIFKSCRVKKMAFNGTTEFNYTYNNQGQVVATYVAGLLNEAFEYNNLGKVSRHITLRSGTDTSAIHTFEYNNDSLVTKLTNKVRFNPTDPFYVSSILTIQYDNQKRRIQTLEQSFSPARNTKSDYIYLIGNKLKINVFNLDTLSNSWELSAEQEITFDNQKRPYYGNNEVFGDVINHNVLSIESKYYAGGVVASTNTSITNHSFNASGYPTESIRTSLGQPTIMYKYEYDCQ